MTRRRPVAFLVTCEHGGARVPPVYRSLFVGAEALLASHQGWDPGAAPLARYLAQALDAPLHLATLTRLLVDLNRSAGNPRVFSQRSRALARPRRLALLAAHHAPHRTSVDAAVAELAREGGPVVHLAVHTFTPVLNGSVRGADIALLYDPARGAERSFCAAWAGALAGRFPDLAVRRNQPYRGASDGLTTWLRTRHPGRRYLGVEIEVNQRLLGPGGRFPRWVGRGLAESLTGLEEAAAR